jgi:hypothetical protein
MANRVYADVRPPHYIVHGQYNGTFYSILKPAISYYDRMQYHDCLDSRKHIEMPPRAQIHNEYFFGI